MTKPIAPDTLMERFPGLRRVVHELRLSQGVFRDYGYQHQDKADAATTTKDRLERERKAKRNLDRAAACQEALNAFDAAGGIEALEANNRQLQLCREALRNIAFTAVPLKSDSEETLRNNSQAAANMARHCLASIEGVGE